MNKEIKTYLPHFFLLSTFIFESLAGQLLYFFGTSFGLTFFMKSIALGYFISVSFLLHKKVYALFGFLFLLFVISQFSYPQFEFDVLKNLHMFINYMYPFVLLMGLNEVITERNATTLKKIMQLGLLVVLASIIVGAVFGIQSFMTYFYRFGVKGLINSPATASYFILFSWIVFLQKQWKIKFQTLVFFLLFLVSLLVGTKACLLFLVFVFIHVLYRKQLHFNSIKLKVGLLGVIIFVASMVYFYSVKFQQTKEIYLELYTNEGLVSALSSFRSRKFSEIINYYLENWNALNYAFGGRHVFVENFEFDALDVLLHFGIVGTLIYTFVFKKVVMPFVPKNQFILFSGMLIVAFLAGQLFYNTYILLLLAYYLVIQHKLTKSSSL